MFEWVSVGLYIKYESHLLSSRSGKENMYIVVGQWTQAFLNLFTFENRDSSACFVISGVKRPVNPVSFSVHICLQKQQMPWLSQLIRAVVAVFRLTLFRLVDFSVDSEWTLLFLVLVFICVLLFGLALNLLGAVKCTRELWDQRCLASAQTIPRAVFLCRTFYSERLTCPDLASLSKRRLLKL